MAAHSHRYHHRGFPRFGIVYWNPRWCKCGNDPSMLSLRLSNLSNCIPHQCHTYIRCLNTLNSCGWAHGSTLTPLPRWIIFLEATLSHSQRNKWVFTILITFVFDNFLEWIFLYIGIVQFSWQLEVDYNTLRVTNKQTQPPWWSRLPGSSGMAFAFFCHLPLAASA